MNQTSNVILLHEPDAALRADFANGLAAAGWTVEAVATWEELLQLQPALPPRLVVVGVGAETPSLDLAPLVAQHAQAQVIVLATSPGKDVLLEWFHAGVRDVLPRPVDAEVLVAVCGAYQCAAVARGTPAEMSGADRSMLSRAVHVLLDILEARDRQCVREAKEAADLCVRIGTVLGLSPRALQSLRLGVMLHDIGCIGLRDEVVTKGGTTSPLEHAHLATHVVFGEKIVAQLISEADVLGVIRHHHEWYNGRGYPDGLRGDEIPLGARILAAADAFLALTEHCPQSRRKSEQDALRDLCHRVGLQFCPKVMGGLLQALGYRRPETAAPVETAGESMPSADEAHVVDRRALEAKLDRVVDLRAMPTIVAEVLEMTSNQDLRVDDLAAKIKCDQALSTKLLRLANSAFYGSRAKVESIDRAVLKLGIERVRQLVLGIGVIDHWKPNQDPGLLAGGAFWQHSMSTALLARQISVMIDYPDDQNAFTAGLLHDTGQLLFQEGLGRNYVAILANARRGRGYLAAIERQFLEVDHATVMYQVGPKWHLPQKLVEVMALHHAPWEKLAEVNPETLRLVLCVRLANILSHGIGCGDAELGSLEQMPPKYAEMLHLDRRALDEALSSIPQQVALLSRAYGLASEGDGLVTRRRPPQRRGYYLTDAEAAIDPIRTWLGSEGAEFETANEATVWHRNAETTWCWVRTESVSLARATLDVLKSSEAESRKARSHLIFLMPATAPADLRQLVTEANVAVLQEPWNVAALKGMLDRVRAVRSPTEHAERREIPV
jgi:HD-GYP domain-containing protein (c-di-GMP phosphodiesterase class II)